MSRKRPTFSKAVAPPRDLCYNQQERISFSESIDVIDHIFFFFSVGRFTQEDTHWNTSNMIYGDEPQQIGEYEDPLGTSRYTYAPQVTAVMQAGNLYGYCVENPVRYTDTSGYSIKDDLRSLINEHPNIWSFRCDALGIVILLHYLYGKGETLELLDNQRIDNNTTIKDYMTSNQMLKRKVQEIVFPMGESLKPGETITIDITTAMEIDNGEDIIGYQYLHGTNEDVGGFQIKGTISKNELGDVTYDLTYIWNDIIDPNYQYASDAAKAKIAQMIPFAIPTDYIIRILWRDKTVIRVKPGLFKRNTGWLK